MEWKGVVRTTRFVTTVWKADDKKLSKLFIESFER